MSKLHNFAIQMEAFNIALERAFMKMIRKVCMVGK